MNTSLWVKDLDLLYVWNVTSFRISGGGLFLGKFKGIVGKRRCSVTCSKVAVDEKSNYVKTCSWWYFADSKP